MKVSNQPKLMFHGVDVVNLKLDTFSTYDHKTGIDFNISPSVFYNTDDKKHFKILMEVSLTCEKFFNIKLVAIGNFQFDSDFDDPKLKKNFVNANAPAIMFPYVRAFINTLTSNLGNVTGALTIPTQFFQGDLPEVSDELEDSE